MATKIKLGKGNWGVKENGLLAYNDEDGIFKAIEMNHSRSSTATRVNSSGTIVESEIGVPRIDFTDDANGALLLEPLVTNLNTFSDPTDSQKGSTSYASVTYQDDFDWGSGSVLKNGIVFIDNATTRYAYYNCSVLGGSQYSLSFFIKMDDNSTPIPLTDFSVVLSGTSLTSGYIVESFANNIYRVSVTGVASASNDANGILKTASNSAKGFTISGFQIENLPYSTSYIPTSGAIATRIADTCSKSGLENYINSSEGVLYVECSFANQQVVGARVLSVSDGTNDNSVTFYNPANSTNLGIYIEVNNTVIFNNAGASTLTLSDYFKLAIQYKSGQSKAYLNGVELFDVTGTFSGGSFDRLIFGNVSGGQPFYGKVKDLRVYDTALSDAELTTLTTL
jgi:hypothetical protein